MSKWYLTLGQENSRSQSVFIVWQHRSVSQSGWKVGDDKVEKLRSHRVRSRECVHAQPWEEIELIYVLQVDMGLIAMVTGHVPHHLPWAQAPSCLSSSRSSYSHPSSEEDGRASPLTVAAAFWELTPLDVECAKADRLPTAHLPIATSRGSSTASNNSPSIPLMIPLSAPLTLVISHCSHRLS